MNWALPAADTYFAPLLEQDPRGFQIDHLALALKHCTQFRMAIDGGAHIGSWSVEMAKHFGQVLAFEPAADTFKCLQENVKGLTNVTTFMLALGEKTGTARILDDPMREGNTGARYLDFQREGTTQIVPIDEFGMKELDFLKLDVEGYERFALVGAKETLLRCRPVVMIEVKRFKPPRFGVDVSAAMQFLNGIGYREVANARNDRVFVHAA